MNEQPQWREDMADSHIENIPTTNRSISLISQETTLNPRDSSKPFLRTTYRVTSLDATSTTANTTGTAVLYSSATDAQIKEYKLNAVLDARRQKAILDQKRLSDPTYSDPEIGEKSVQAVIESESRMYLAGEDGEYRSSRFFPLIEQAALKTLWDQAGTS